MVYVSGPVGDRFERYFAEHFPGFESHTKDGENIPDFYNPKFGFWLEAKAGNVGWGVQLKARQLRFENLTEPVVYCVGLHSLVGTMEILKRKTYAAAAKILENNLLCRVERFS